jgi:hypothetical protein
MVDLERRIADEVAIVEEIGRRTRGRTVHILSNEGRLITKDRGRAVDAVAILTAERRLRVERVGHVTGIDRRPGVARKRVRRDVVRRRRRGDIAIDGLIAKRDPDEARAVEERVAQLRDGRRRIEGVADF